MRGFRGDLRFGGGFFAVWLWWVAWLMWFAAGHFSAMKSVPVFEVYF
jgi:hypothetical protein